MRNRLGMGRMSWGLAILVAAVAACSDGGGYQGKAKYPDPPAHPGALEDLVITVWDAPGGTLTFLPEGQATFKPKQPGAPDLPGSYTLENGIATVVIIGVEPIAAVWDGEKLVIQGVECTLVERAADAPLPSGSAS